MYISIHVYDVYFGWVNRNEIGETQKPWICLDGDFLRIVPLVNHHQTPPFERIFFE